MAQESIYFNYVDFVTPVGRANWVKVKEPADFNGDGKFKYSIVLLFSKDDKEGIQKIKDYIKKASKEWLATMGKAKLPPNFHNPLIDGDAKYEEDPEAYAAYENCYFMTCKSPIQPKVVDFNKEEILDLDDLYSGCYARASMPFRPYKTGASSGISSGLYIIQKVEDGERLGGSGRGSVDDFDDLEDLGDIL